MPNKLVYLFELDSVRNRYSQINAGLKALYDEIVINGNTVVFTFNQIADSALFYELMRRARHEEDGETFENLVKLFQNGALKISQFGDIRTIVQYLINKLEVSDPFVFSAWPIKKSQPKLCALIKRSLETCDLSELSYFKSENVDKQRLRRLFFDKQSPDDEFNDDELLDKISMIYWLVRFVLRVSIIPDIYLPPKVDGGCEFKMFNLLEFVVENLNNGGTQVLTTLPAFISRDGSRSVYEENIDDLSKQMVDEQAICEARLIVDLCYNYASEYSIFGVSLHYPAELNGKIGPNEFFFEDFLSRYKELLTQLKEVDLGESRDDNYYIPAKQGDIKFPNLNSAVKVAQLSQKKHSLDFQNRQCAHVGTYEEGFLRSKREHRKNLFRGFLSRIVLLMLCLFIAVCIDFSTNGFEDVVTNSIPYSDVLTVMLETLLFLLVSEYVTVLISKKITCFVSLSEAIAEVVGAGRNAFRTFRSLSIIKNGVSECQQVRKVEAKLWQPTISKSLKKGRAVWEDKFTEEQLADFEETNFKQLGLIYESEYHNFYVDPTGEGPVTGFFERLVNTNEGAVVMIPVHKNKLVFLKQFRHSLQREDYSFPRGFGEKDVTVEKNVFKELLEELETSVIGDPVWIGKCYPDTGIIGSFADVFLVEIDQVNLKVGYEGITGVCEIAPEDACGVVNANDSNAPFKLTDGFSLAALALLHAKLTAENATISSLLSGN